MNVKNFFLGSILLISHLFFANELHIEQVLNPCFSKYESLFLKFGHGACVVCSGRQSVYKGLKIACFVKNIQSYLDSFHAESDAYEQNFTNRIFLQATLLDEVVGYISCQIDCEHEIYISQIAFDPEKYDSLMIQELLFALFQSMPKIKVISISCPAFCPELMQVLQELGFVQTDKLSSTNGVDLFVTYALKVHPKCGMCQILYGPDFWYQDVDDDSDWDFCQLDQQGNLCPEQPEES